MTGEVAGNRTRWATNLECRACKVALSGDDVTDLLVDLFRSIHRGHDSEETVE